MIVTVPRVFAFLAAALLGVALLGAAAVLAASWRTWLAASALCAVLAGVLSEERPR